MKRFVPMFRKELIQMRRDRVTLSIMIGIPVIQLMLFGFAIQTDVRHIPTVVLDESRTPTSRDVIAAFENTGNFRIVAHVDGRVELDEWIARGDAQAGIAIPHDLPRDLARGTTATIQVIVDASDPLSSQAALSAAVDGTGQTFEEITQSTQAYNVYGGRFLQAVPEPSSATLLAVVGAGMLARRRRSA